VPLFVPLLCTAAVQVLWSISALFTSAVLALVASALSTSAVLECAVYVSGVGLGSECRSEFLE